jgi:hypothetical protein
LEGPTVVGRTSDWKVELGRFHSQAVSGSVGSQGAATQVSNLRVEADRSVSRTVPGRRGNRRVLARLSESPNVRSEARAPYTIGAPRCLAAAGSGRHWEHDVFERHRPARGWNGQIQDHSGSHRANCSRGAGSCHVSGRPWARMFPGTHPLEHQGLRRHRDGAGRAERPSPNVR